MAKKRVLAKVGIKAKKGELVYYKDGVLYAVEAKRGGTKGAKRKCSTTTTKRKAAPRKKAAAKKTTARKKAASKKRTAAKRKR